MIEAIDLAFAYTETPLYEGVNFIVGKGQKIGLVGPNGSGKSTLLKLISKEEVPHHGVIKAQGRIASVPQEVTYDENLEKASTIRNYLDPAGEYQDYELRTMMSGLELNLTLDQAPQKLSGGQKTKLALCRALLSKPDILLLDEPTNFMDVEGKRWVMNFLSKYESSVIIISHDLKLLDNALEKVLEVDPAIKKITEYKGNYSSFVKLKKEREELLRRQIIVKQKHIKQMEEGLHKMARFTSAKGVRARVRQQKRIEKEKLHLPQLPPEVKSIKINLPEPAKVGELPIRAEHIKKSYAEKQVLRDVNFFIERGERIALIGSNGAGKSTFIKILMGLLKPDFGVVLPNPTVKIGYYSQEFETFDMNQSVIDLFTSFSHADEFYARSFLGKYMFSGNKVFQKVSLLSGGEKTRLSIALITSKDYNLLILDEPTTYLDVTSQRVILESLKGYKGAMIIVSHTPQFIKELEPSRAYLFPEEKMVYWDDELLDRVPEL